MSPRMSVMMQRLPAFAWRSWDPSLMRRVGNFLLPAAVVVAVFVVWAGSVSLFTIPNYLLPGPGEVIERIVHDRAIFWKHSLATLSVILIGFAIGVVFGVILALAILLRSGRIIGELAVALPRPRLLDMAETAAFSQLAGSARRLQNARGPID
jgi:ABC-type sugar transport system permease subunit